MVQSSLFIAELDNRFQLTDLMITQAAKIANYQDESEFLLYLDSLGITKRTNIFKTGGAEKFNSMFPNVLDSAI